MEQTLGQGEAEGNSGVIKSEDNSLTRRNEEKFVLANEFAHVEVALDFSANGPRLRIRDMREGGMTSYFDPLLVEILTRMPKEMLHSFVS